MDSIYILGAVVIVAYILQIIFGLKQLKHFNTTYSELRKKRSCGYRTSIRKNQGWYHCHVCSG